jgi:CheY-like chemotaxis protein
MWKNIPRFIHRSGSLRRRIHRRAGGQITVPNILILDSHTGVQELLREEFLSEGCRVVATGDLDHLYALIQSCRPHLVILDPFLNREYRWDLLNFLKSSYPHLPVLIVTAYAGGPDDAASFFTADGYVQKSSTCIGEVKRKAAAILTRRPRHFYNSEGLRFFPEFRAAPLPRFETAR